MIPKIWLPEAYQRIKPHIYKTPLSYDSHHDMYLKWENHQITGSFKLRGALNKVLSLETWEHEQGLVTASAGNHGQGVALAGKRIGASVTIFASKHTIPTKVMAMRNLGADIRLVPGGYGEAEQAGLSHAASSRATWISAYNDGYVIAGQASLGLEVLEELIDLCPAAWIVPVGGGGLISGIGAALEGVSPRPRLIAVQSEASPFMHALYKRGSQENVVELPSLADGLAGPVEDGSVTIPMARHYIDDFVLVTEDEIAQAIAFAWHRYNERIEGSAGVALAAVLTDRVNYRPAVVMLTGGNIQPEEHVKIIEDYPR